MIKVFYIVSGSIAILAGLYALSNWFRNLKEVDNSYKRKRYIRNGIASAIIVVLTVSYLVFVYGVDALAKQPELKPVEVLDLGGSYSGYITNELGTQIPTYLKVELSNKSDSIIFKFRNDLSFFYHAEYFTDQKLIIIENLGKGNVNYKGRTVKIESQDNIEIRWKFTKEIIGY